MARKKKVEETIEENEELPVHEFIGPPNCPFCGDDGQKTVGWDEEGNEITEPCSECQES